MKIRNTEKFALFAQINLTLRRTLRCHAALIEDLMAEVFDFVLTVRFQSDALEKRQYRQISGGRFLVSLKDVNCSELSVRLKPD